MIFSSRSFIFCLFLVLLFSEVGFGQNVMITDKQIPNEPSIMLDVKNPNFMVAATNINQFLVSQDTGRTWTRKPVSSTYGVWGDPALAIDTSGDVYFFHLSNPQDGNWIDRIVCQKSTNQGQSFNNGSFMGLNGTKAQDKQWFAIDPKTNNIYVTWTQFDDYDSSNPLDSSIILFSKSVDGGSNWSVAKRISYRGGDCIDSDNTVEGAVPTVGPNGELYVAWAGPEGLVFNKSYDQGETWLPRETKVDPMPTGWDYLIAGIGRSNGLPITVCDVSNSAYRGTIYINWSDQRNGANNTDIWIASSQDEGKTWSSPVKVNNDDSERQQFFTWMTIDQTNGYIYCVFYDRRNYTDTKTDVYIAVSIDGGKSFTNKKISESPFVPDQDVFFGDYNNIVAHNGIVRPIWTRLHNGKLSVWTHITDQNKLLSATDDPVVSVDKFEFESYPNPAANHSFVSFKLRKLSVINLDLIDGNGQIVKSMMKGKEMDAGKYIERVELDNLGLPSGGYYLRLMIDNTIIINRLVKI
jgi:hypothetical protein